MLVIFSFSININAELSKYRVIIEAEYNGIFESINNIGDNTPAKTPAKIQSNAAAPSYNGSSSEYESEFIRVYSGGNTSSSGMLSNVDVIGQVMPLSVDGMIPVIRQWMDMADQIGVPIQFESHRNCITNDLYSTLCLLDAIPEMRMCADLSHY